MYSLRRESDGRGDSGSQSTGLYIENEEIKYEANARPRVGIAMRVGSHFARTYDAQDWWQTTLITEILEESEEVVRFRTGNSVYEWRHYV
jgi:hypothetical protein